MSQSMNHRARPVSTEDSQNGSDFAPPYEAHTTDGRSDGVSHDENVDNGANTGHQYGLSYEATPNSPDGLEMMMSSPGLESIQYLDADKESYQPGSYEYKPPPEGEGETPQQYDPQKKRICGAPLWLFITLLAGLIALAVGLGVGLGVGLSGSTNLPSAGATYPTNPSYLSTTGAFNGTGIALATESFGQDNYGTVVVYFQHWTGQIRQMQLASDGSWVGGDETNIVATNARNGTPIAAVAYAMDAVSTWHIFYVDEDHVLQEVINGNTTNSWQPGPLGSFGFKAMDDPNVGLQGCWEGYRPGGQINAVPIAGTGHNYTDSSQTEGINLWYGADPTTLQSVGWTFGTTTWSKQETLGGFNAHAGIGCYSWGPGTVTYLMASDLSDTVNIWWKDLNMTAAGNSSHPIGTWTNTSVAMPDSYQNTSLGYTSYLFAQDSALNVVGYNVSWNAENTYLVSGDDFEIQNDLGIAGTHLTVTAVPVDSGGQTLLVFNQVAGDSITEYTRDLYGGQWTSATLRIPHE